MKQAPIPANDRERLQALEDYEILATKREAWFDHIVKVASQVCETPIALVSIVGREQQFFKAAEGLPEGLTQGARANSFCGHAIVEPGIFEIQDTFDDERFRDNPWVTGKSAIRFYAGARLLNDAGFALGTICVLDHHPRRLTESQKEALQSLASVVMEHIETQRSENFGRHLQRIIETSDHFVAILDAVDFRVLHVNERLEKLLGNSDGPPDLRSLPVEEIFPSLDMQLLRDLADQDAQTATPTDLVSIPLLGADQQDYVVRLRITPSQVRERRVLLLVAEDMGESLTFLRQSERAASEVRRLALVARLTENPVIITDAEDSIEWVNPSFERLTGYSLDEVIGQCPGDFLQGPDTDEGTRRRIAIAVQSGNPVREEILNYHRDGSSYWLDLDIQPVYSKQNELVSFVAVQTDITKRKELEENLRRARDAAELSNQAKSQFLANISHELRTPLNGIIGITELLDYNPNRPDLRNQLATLRDSATGLMEIINDLLDLSKIQAQSLDLELRPFDLKGLVRNLENLFRPQVEQKALVLAVSIGAGVPDHVRGDSLRLKQVLMNLLSNALKFTDQGSIELSVANESDSAEAPNLTFSVSDSGRGVDESAQERIFEAFGQEDASMARRYGGTGLGLTISQRLVGLMGGTLRLSSSKGEGARFYFTLPLEAALPEYHEPLPTPEAGVKQQPSAHDFRVLLVDDNPLNRQVEGAMVEEFGGRVQCCQTGEEAISAFENAYFDLVLLDIQMPDMNGYEVAARLRACEADSGDRTPIIAVTGHNMLDPNADSQQCIDAVIIKPLTLSGLRDSIEHFLGKLEPLSEQPRSKGIDNDTVGATDASLIDEALMTRKLNGNVKLIARLQGLFQQQHSDYIQRLEEALMNGDNQSLANVAHSLKSSVGYFNQGALWQEVVDLERAARSGEAGLAERVARVKAGVLQLADAVRTYRPE